MKQLICLIVAVTFANSVSSAENEKIIKIDWNLTVPKFDFPDSSELDSPGSEISSLLEHWTSYQEVANGKKFKIGSSDRVHGWRNHGLFETILRAYGKHYILKTSPDDWWLVISQQIAMKIDDWANHPDVRKFFVSHEGKKALTVDIGPSIYSIGDWFFEAMKDEIQKNINNPRYTEIMDLDFSTSSLT